MKWVLILGGIAAVAFLMLLVFSLCVVAKRSDERIEEMMRDKEA